jgi:hypothetical protein
MLVWEGTRRMAGLSLIAFTAASCAGAASPPDQADPDSPGTVPPIYFGFPKPEH